MDREVAGQVRHRRTSIVRSGSCPFGAARKSPHKAAPRSARRESSSSCARRAESGCRRLEEAGRIQPPRRHLPILVPYVASSTPRPWAETVGKTPFRSNREDPIALRGRESDARLPRVTFVVINTRSMSRQRISSRRFATDRRRSRGRRSACFRQGSGRSRAANRSAAKRRPCQAAWRSSPSRARSRFPAIACGRRGTRRAPRRGSPSMRPRMSAAMIKTARGTPLSPLALATQRSGMSVTAAPATE